MLLFIFLICKKLVLTRRIGNGVKRKKKRKQYYDLNLCVARQEGLVRSFVPRYSSSFLRLSSYFG